VGDEQTIEKLKQLAATGHFSKSETESLIRTSDIIERRLNQ